MKASYLLLSFSEDDRMKKSSDLRSAGAFADHCGNGQQRPARRRMRAAGTFPDGNSALMPVCAKLRHAAGTRRGSKKYMNMKHLKATLDDASIAG